MQYIDIIQGSIDYIEKNLKTEISAEELARQAGFSLYHYYRIFQSAVGMPVMQYIQRRRLMNAIYEISQGNKMIDVALAYGYGTHAGFFKAFKREYNCSPSEYLKNHTVFKPYKINFLKEELIMLSHSKIKNVLEKYWNMCNASINDVSYDGSGVKRENVWYVNDDYVMKAGTNINGLKKQIEISKALAKAGMLAPIPVPAKDGNDFSVEGDIFFCLTNRLQEDRIKSGDCFNGDIAANARFIGECIGKLHMILIRHDNKFICNEPNMYENILNWAMPETKKVMGLPDSFFEDYINTFGRLFPLLPKHIIHRDPHPGNIIVTKDKTAGFIDFDLSERNIRIFDPCYASTAILSESFAESDPDKLEKWPVIFKNIISGYDSIAKLTSEEKMAIPYVIFSIQMIFVAYCDDIEKFHELGKTNQKMLKWLIDNNEILKIQGQ